MLAMIVINDIILRNVQGLGPCNSAADTLQRKPSEFSQTTISMIGSPVPIHMAPATERTLTIRIERARNLPGMDFFGYCRDSLAPRPHV
jgi:hypothetical protein